MRGRDERSGSLFSYVDIEARIGVGHPLRQIRDVVNEALSALTKSFAALYAREGRPSIPPERLLRASLLQLFYSIRSERQLMERLDFDLLFRWFVGLGIDDPVWDATVFSKNRDRLLNTEIAPQFLSALLSLPRVRKLLSREHFAGAALRVTVDGTLLKAWALMKSFRPKDGSSSPSPWPPTTSSVRQSSSPRQLDIPVPRRGSRHPNIPLPKAQCRPERRAQCRVFQQPARRYRSLARVRRAPALKRYTAQYGAVGTRKSLSRLATASRPATLLRGNDAHL